jgi:uncharacterized protein YbaA (DUF1428 family)
MPHDLDGCAVPVPKDKIGAYRKAARLVGSLRMDQGVVRRPRTPGRAHGACAAVLRVDVTH